MKHLFVFLSVLMLLLLFSCKKNNLNIQPVAACDSGQVSWTTCIQPVMKKYCISCHSTGNTSGGIALDNYKTVRLIASDGDLMGVTQHLDGYPYMPPQIEKIDSFSRLLIRRWIQSAEPE